MIQVDDVSKIYRINKSLAELLFYPRRKAKSVKALDSVSLRVKKGEILALLGPNGAGKTTLIKILCSLILADSGSIKICGYDLRTSEEEAMSKIGLVTGEERSLYWQLTGRQNLEFFGAIYNLSKKAVSEKISEINEILRIDDLDKLFRTYSTGMKHRLMLARCLMSDPEVIFMDEPTKSMDPASAKYFRDFIKKTLSKEMKKTVLFATHETHEAEKLADKIAIIDKGRIKTYGEFGELKNKWGLNKDSTLEELYLKVVGTDKYAQR